LVFTTKVVKIQEDEFIVLLNYCQCFLQNFYFAKRKKNQLYQTSTRHKAVVMKLLERQTNFFFTINYLKRKNILKK